jgi:hypothetical protein
MTTTEFSNEFDVLAQSYLREGGFTVSDSSLLAFNEYEKSVYLTREQEQLVIALYSGNTTYGGFELTEQMRRSLDSLLDTAVLDPVSGAEYPIADGSQLFELPEQLWYIVYEAGSYQVMEDNCPVNTDSFPVEIIPVTYDDLHTTKGNPFRGPSRRRALRLDKGKDDVTTVEIIPKYSLGKYYVKYIRRPDPIILTDLGDLKINGISVKTGCSLHESLHRIILDGAVRAAVNGRIPPSSDGKS